MRLESSHPCGNCDVYVDAFSPKDGTAHRRGKRLHFHWKQKELVSMRSLSVGPVFPQTLSTCAQEPIKTKHYKIAGWLHPGAEVSFTHRKYSALS